MRFTAVQRIINDERGLAIWNSHWKYNAYYLHFQYEFDKYKNVGGRVYDTFSFLNFDDFLWQIKPRQMISTGIIHSYNLTS